MLTFVSDSAWMLGTFNARDTDLSAAEQYYLQQVYTMNEHMILCGAASTWKNGLRSFGIDTDAFNQIPAVFNNTTNWDDSFAFDVWKIWGYLCAYCYKYNESAKESEMWQFDDETKFALNLLLQSQYEFTHNYAENGYWERVYSAALDADYSDSFPAGSNTVIRGVYTFSDAAIPAVLRPFSEDHGGTFWVIYNLDNNEILNANDGFSPTGWYINKGTEPNKCRYQQRYQWRNTTALFYGIRKKRSLDAAIETVLTTMNPELYQYYLVLTEGTAVDDGTPIRLYGGHQAMRSPLPESMRTLMESERILHNFGMDMPDGQGWGAMHCGMASAHTAHDGVDIIANSNVPVYAMFAGKITSVSGGRIVLEVGLHLWMDAEETTPVRATYTAVTPANGISAGDCVQEGQLIGYTTDRKQCADRHYDTGIDYLHISVECQYAGIWCAIDPRLMIE